MPRSNRRRVDSAANESFERFVSGHRRTEVRAGGEWNVQPVSQMAAQKEYTCPGCRRVIAPGTAHLVAWRADGILGDVADLAARRHWHTTCWRTR